MSIPQIEMDANKLLGQNDGDFGSDGLSIIIWYINAYAYHYPAFLTKVIVLKYYCVARKVML